VTFPTLAQATLVPFQSSQTMLMNRGPAAQLWVDSDPDGWVDVQRHRKPIAEQSPA
jgi:glycogen debranching enzyme